MSKKKAFSGSTMTLKDFHGGSIPSDLPLPSAPGVTARSTDRSGFDRQIPTAWGNPMGRSDYRPRPGSSGATRTFDEKASFLSHPAHIGRNFDEDERKPLDGLSAPRRTVSDENIHVAPIRSEPKLDSVSSGKFSGQSVSASVPISSSVAANPYPTTTKFTAGTSAGANLQNPSGNNGHNVSSYYPNAWGMRKDVISVTEPVPSSAWSGPSAVSRFAQASALEKVSSGRWQSKHSTPDIEVIRYSEMESDFYSKDNSLAPVSERIDYDGIQGRFAERVGKVKDGVRSGVSEFLDSEKSSSTIQPEAKEKNSPFYLDGARPASAEDKFGGSQMQLQVPSEVSERPKLKLFPRSKPLETSEQPAADYKQGFQQRPLSSHLETVNESHANVNPPKPGSPGSKGVNQTVERPKLNLKPRSQPLEQSEGNVERERKMFGGARPRELVLKERGFDDVTLNNLEVGQPVNRVKHDIPKIETKQEPVLPTARYVERTDTFPLNRRTGRDHDRKDIHVDTEKADIHNSRRNDTRRNNRETEKHQRENEWRPEPDTWRKPMEQPKPSSPNTLGPRFGKSASAAELAQAFSRSMSDAKPGGTPNRNQLPFSRLTDTREFYSGSTPRHQINGY